jgi:hypothetical protein
LIAVKKPKINLNQKVEMINFFNHQNSLIDTKKHEIFSKEKKLTDTNKINLSILEKKE